MNSSSQSEVQLVRALQSRQADDFSLVYDAYAPALYGILLRLANDPVRAESLLQEAFVKIWSNSHRYDPQKDRLFTWLMAITHNLALDELKMSEDWKAVNAYLNANTPPKMAQLLGKQTNTAIVQEGSDR